MLFFLKYGMKKIISLNVWEGRKMRTNFYEQNTANFPRIQTDTLFVDYSNTAKYSGFMDNAFTFVENSQLLRPELWDRFVRQFREEADDDNGWRGEYWGKMMRGASFVYSYTKNEELYRILTQTVNDMIETANEVGRISSYRVDLEFDGWDLWSRKYVLLGMQYFLEICDDDTFKAKIVDSMCKQVDYIASKIGKAEDGKLPITSATCEWRGLNSSSLLEPIVRLYNITAEQKYFDFAEYIVEAGCTDISNIFNLAYKNEFYPYQYPVTKAYEMISCFEGLLEFYRITKDDRHKTAILNFSNRLLESEITVIGTCGCTSELFDHSVVRQANTTNHPIKQETCVTVTLMKFLYQLTLLTGDSKYVDAFENSLYNAYLGAFNTEGKVESRIAEQHPEWILEALPFDSYSPLTAGRRGYWIGGLKGMSDNHYYGCCACIGSAGIGLAPKMQLLTTKNGFALNLFINGTVASKTPSNQDVAFNLRTAYPVDGTVEITVNTAKPESFELLIRNPGWSKTTSIAVNGTPVSVSDGYTRIERVWQAGDTVTVKLDMRTEVIRPIPYGTQILMTDIRWGYNYSVPVFDREDPLAKHHVALRRGPIMLAQENRLGYSVDDAVDIKINDDGYVDVDLAQADTYPNILAVNVPLEDGKTMLVTDYASAGKLWSDESKMAVWMLTK